MRNLFHNILVVQMVCHEVSGAMKLCQNHQRLQFIKLVSGLHNAVYAIALYKITVY